MPSKKKTTTKRDDRIASMKFATVYPLYVAKVEKKGRTEEELVQVICWLTGYTAEHLKRLTESPEADMKHFLNDATIHPNASKINGKVCGHKVEEIENPLTRQTKYMDKLVDELAKGWKMEKILRC